MKAEQPDLRASLLSQPGEPLTRHNSSITSPVTGSPAAVAPYLATCPPGRPNHNDGHPPQPASASATRCTPTTPIRNLRRSHKNRLTCTYITSRQLNIRFLMFCVPQSHR
jgi:hypothetical protein